MRGVYLRAKCRDGGSRGGVGSKHDDYALEIGASQNADCEMLALASMVDEVKELLELSNSPLAKMVLNEWRKTTDKLLKDSQI